MNSIFDFQRGLCYYNFAMTTEEKERERKYFNKARPEIEYGMICQRKLNNPKRKKDKDGLITYYYVTEQRPLAGNYYVNGKAYIIPVRVAPELYIQLTEQDKKEHNNNHKHDRRYLDIESHFKLKGEIDGDGETNPWECVACQKTINYDDAIAAHMDRRAVKDAFSKEERRMVKLFKNGYPQQVIARRLKKSQSYVSKHLSRLLERLDREELDDGSRTCSDIDFEIMWKKFALSHKTDDYSDVILETFHYLLGAQAWEEFLIWFFSFTEYYRFALKVLFTLDDCPWDDARGHINDLPYRYRAIFAERLEDEADIFARLYYFIVQEVLYRQSRFPRPEQQAYEDIIAREEKTAHRLNMTWEQFRAERLNKYVIEILEKRTSKFLAENNVYVFDENADIDRQIKKIMARKKGK